MAQDLWAEIDTADAADIPIIARVIIVAKDDEREACAHRLEIVASTYMPGGPMDAKGGLLLGVAAIRARTTP